MIYDGKAYRELLRRYPHSGEAMEARQLLGKNESKQERLEK
jgi:hypothetical protein